MKSRQNHRKGAVAVLLGFLMLPLLALLALSVDYGFLLYIRTDLQRVADQASLAAVRELAPDADGNQNLEKVREVVREYVQYNLGDNFVVHDEDIKIGRYNPDSIYTEVEFLPTGPFDTVRVQVRRDDVANNSVSLYFARIFGNEEFDVAATSTAILQKARYLGPGAPVFPFAIEDTAWNAVNQGETASIYGDGHIENRSGQTISGNFGTVNVGPTSNGTSKLGEQIAEGLKQSHLDNLADQGAIPSAKHIDSQSPMTVSGNPGLSSGLKHYVHDVEGSMKLIPIYGSVTGKGGSNVKYEIIGWGAVEVVDSRWSGSKNTYIEVRKAFMYTSGMQPGNSLSETSSGIEGVFTSPVLVE